jgi:Tfp pilus assembly protein PilF
MGEIRKSNFSSLSRIILFSVSCFLLYSCSLPKIIVYDDPLSAKEHNDLGVVYYKKGEYDLAEKEFLKALKKDRNFYLAYFNLGNLYYKKGDLKKSIEFFKKALEINKNDDVLNNLGYVFLEIKDCKNVKYYLDQIKNIENKPEYKDTHEKYLKICNSTQYER